MCIGGKKVCTCGDTIADECWEYHNEQQAREIERQIFEETGEEVIAELTGWMILSDDEDGAA